MKTLKVAMLSSFVGGFLQIYSYVLKGGFFAPMITSNTIRLIYDISNIISIIFFILGVFIALMIDNKKKLIILEIFFVLLVYFLKDEKYIDLSRYIMTVMGAIQLQIFSSAGNHIYAPTMMSGNTRKLAESLYKKDKEAVIIFLFVILSFIFGTYTGNKFVYYLEETAILILILLYIFLYKLVEEE